MIPVQYRLKAPNSPLDDALYHFGASVRCALPAIVVSFDAGGQYGFPSVSAQPAVREVMNNEAVPTLYDLPICDAVPVLYPGGGGFSLTFPLQPGDEVLLVFCDMAIDFWKQNGGVQKQPDGVKFRHDIGDAVAIPILRSKPRELANWSTSSAQLRSDDGSVVVDLAAGKITLNAAAISLLSGSGTPQTLMTNAFYTWFVTYILPHISTPPGTPPPPTDSLTTIVEAE